VGVRDEVQDRRGGADDAQPALSITSSSRNREGAYVCFNGRTSGARCGEVERVNTTYNRRKNLGSRYVATVTVRHAALLAALLL
jgi:hypothetical protein